MKAPGPHNYRDLAAPSAAFVRAVIFGAFVSGVATAVVSNFRESVGAVRRAAIFAAIAAREDVLAVREDVVAFVGAVRGVVAVVSAGPKRLARMMRMARGRARCGHRATAGEVESRAGFGWSISALAACMAPAARRRWLDGIAETLHDFDPGEHRALLSDYRQHAVVVILRSWTVDYVRSGASR